MWVLSARENAEKVWYAIIWEETKEASNVIDYNINEEITKDTSAVFNANNDTTTGMATVIPWVNAPKLIATTSIYNNDVDKYWECNVSWSWYRMLAAWDYGVWYIKLTLNSQSWPYTFQVTEHIFNWVSFPDISLILPKSWIYKLSVKYKCTVNVFYRMYNVYQNLTNIHHFENNTYYSQYGDAYPTEEIYINWNAWDEIMFDYRIENHATWVWQDYVDYSLSATITKL